VPYPGAYPPQQPAPYPPSHQPPPIHRATHPNYDASAHAHAPAIMHSHSSSPPHLSARLPVSPPQSFPVPSVQRGYASAYPSGSPPSSSMMPHDRTMMMPIPGQAYNAQSMPYQIASAPGVAHQQSHSGMPGGQRPVTGGWTRRTCIRLQHPCKYVDVNGKDHERPNSDDEDFLQDSEVTSNGSDYAQERSPPNPPYSSRREYLNHI
jgi:hypothetical protein